MAEQKETDAHILLADISGYTRFLRENQTTLRHANYIISELLAAVMNRAEPQVRVEKLEGDAILFVAESGQSPDTDLAVRRSMFGFFSAFYQRRGELIAANSCPCEACSMVHRLDLKVINHYGQVLRYRLGNFEELAGFDLIIAHRLMKNSVDASRYLLATATAWERVKSEGDALPLEYHVEACEGAGDVAVVVIRGDVPLPQETPPPPPKRSLSACLDDFLIKHLMLLPFLERLVRHGAQKALKAHRH